MNKNDEMQQFKQLLDEQHTWPCRYQFKFVVPAEKEADVRQLLPAAEASVRPSKNGRYVAVTLIEVMEGSANVVEVYSRAAHIDGLISL